VTSLGELFYMFAPATAKARSPIIDYHRLAEERKVERFYFLFNIY